MLVGPGGEAVGSVSGGCVEGAVYELGQSVVESGAPVLQRYGVSDDDAFAVGLTCGGILDVYVEKVNQRDLPRARRDRRGHRGRPTGGAGDRDRAPRPRVAGSADRRTPGRRGRLAGQRAGHRRGDRRRARPAGVRPQRDADLRTRRRAARRGDAGLRVGVRAGAPDAGLRRDRLRGRRGAGRGVPRLPRHRLRRPARLRHQHPLPARRRGGGQLAAQVPQGRERGRPHRPPHGDLRADPRPEVRRTRARAGPAAARGRVRRRDGVASHPRRPARPARARPASTEDELARLSSPIGLDLGRAHARGDRRQHRRRDHRRPLGRQRRPALGHRRPDPRAHAPRSRDSEPCPGCPGATRYRHRDDLLPGAVASARAPTSHAACRRASHRGLPSPWLTFIVSVDGPVRVSGTVAEGDRFDPAHGHVVRRDRGRPAPRGGPGRAADRPGRRPARACTRSPPTSLLGCRAAELLGPGDHGHEVLGRAGAGAARTGERRRRQERARLDVVQQWLRSSVDAERRSGVRPELWRAWRWRRSAEGSAGSRTWPARCS